MQFQISTKEFLKAINIVSRSISSTIPLPSLTGIYLELNDDELILIASDTNISIKSFLKKENENNMLKVLEKGKVVINAKILHDIIQRFSNPITSLVQIDGNLIELKSGNAEFKINTMKVEDYPNIAFENQGEEFKLKTELIKDIVNNVSFACSTDETRPALTGVSLTADGKELLCAATDSFRLAMKKINLNNELHFNIVIPAKYLDKINSCLENIEEINIRIDNQKISFYSEDIIIVARLIDDKFPNITSLLPNHFNQILKINTRNLASAIDRCSIIKTEGKNIIKMDINSERLEVKAVAQEIGSSFDSVPVIEYQGDPLIISCSGKYLSEAIKVIKKEEIELCFNGELKPIIIKDEKDDSFIQFISPVRSYDY